MKKKFSPLWLILNTLYLILWFLSSSLLIFANTFLGKIFFLFNFILNPLILAVSLLTIAKISTANKDFKQFFVKITIYIILISFFLLYIVPVCVALALSPYF